MADNNNYKINVLDKGYVQLKRVSADIDLDGSAELTPVSDLDAVSDARVSTARDAITFGPHERRTLGFLLSEEHTSPFRGTVVTIEVKAPLFVARQWWKYCIGHEHDETFTRDPFLGWNELSRRYVDEEPEFYIPDEWRCAPERRSQGSGGRHEHSKVFGCMMAVTARDGISAYKSALEEGLCAEQARLFLPAYAMYTTWRWTSSLQGVCHFLKQRLAHDAQSEIRQYANAIKELTVPIFPITIERMSATKEQRQ